ncbi:MAG: DUF3124 domain-containing protein [Syntrophorhabdales bacterium]|nr:DUF3124 domain-containing protein [Syntrophorhabdales bacterium]
MNIRRPMSFLFITCILLVFIIKPIDSFGQQEIIRLSRGQTLYVPVYSQIYYGDRERPYWLAVTVSIRNTDQTYPITIIRADYYGTKGELLKRYIDSPLKLNANTSTRFVVKESEDKGGSGANFIVVWVSENAVNPPIIESIMIGTLYQRGISFTSRGQAILEHGAKP